jgi:hypothetical protein
MENRAQQAISRHRSAVKTNRQLIAERRSLIVSKHELLKNHIEARQRFLFSVNVLCFVTIHRGTGHVM